MSEQLYKFKVVSGSFVYKSHRYVAKEKGNNIVTSTERLDKKIQNKLQLLGGVKPAAEDELMKDVDPADVADVVPLDEDPDTKGGDGDSDKGGDGDGDSEEDQNPPLEARHHSGGRYLVHNAVTDEALHEDWLSNEEAEEWVETGSRPE